jgi:hypothetical protein
MGKRHNGKQRSRGTMFPSMTKCNNNLMRKYEFLILNLICHLRIMLKKDDKDKRISEYYIENISP